jgi:hypothetical protein
MPEPSSRGKMLKIHSIYFCIFRMFYGNDGRCPLFEIPEREGMKGCGATSADEGKRKRRGVSTPFIHLTYQEKNMNAETVFLLRCVCYLLRQIRLAIESFERMRKP